MTRTPTMANYVPNLMNARSEQAIIGALSRLCESNALKDAWPAAHDARAAGNPIQLSAVDIQVLPLERIGAPAGASGASVFIACYSERKTSGGGSGLLAADPLVVKIGKAKKLRREKEIFQKWPTLTPDVRSHFAVPLHLDSYNKNIAVLIAPYRSKFQQDTGGRKVRIKSRDLWRLLHHPKELSQNSKVNWSKIYNVVGQALDTVDYVHRDNKAAYKRENIKYSSNYECYLRYTYSVGSKNAKHKHIPNLIFGSEDKVSAFGKEWKNPCRLIDEIMRDDATFEATTGPVHGDLHPKNITLGIDDSAQIIDFGWARECLHIVVDYILLDVNVRSTTLPSQLSERDVLAIATFLDSAQDPSSLPEKVQQRGRLIRNEIWERMLDKEIVRDWRAEYLIPFFIVSYGLLVHLDAARNQSALVACVLAAASKIDEGA